MTLITNLQILRAFAAINVVFFHVLIVAVDYGHRAVILDVLAGWGANGVDIFFVISGFVMLHTQYRNRRRMGEFLRARLIRIVPIYWCTTSLMCFLLLITPFLFRETEFDFSLLLSSYFFLSGIVQYDYPLVNVGWTLEWEMLFYALFAISLLLKSWKQVVFALGLILLIIAVSTGSYLIIEFFLGVLIALIYNRISLKKRTGTSLFLIGGLLLLLSLGDFDTVYQIDRFWRWGIPAAFVVIGLCYMPQISNKTLVYLGDASYSIYLAQVFTIPASYKFFSLFLTSLNNDLLAMLSLIVSVAGGCMMYSFMEKPITKKLLSRPAKRQLVPVP